MCPSGNDPVLGHSRPKRELESLIASKDEFVASVSHELRTPLTGVVGFATALDRDWESYEDAERYEMLRVIADQAADVAEIVDDLLVAARADAGTLTVLAEPLDVRSLVEQVAEPEGVRMVSDAAVAWAHADPTRLRQIVRNLITNAKRYGGENRWLELDSNARFLLLRMCDDGNGVTEADPERMFLAYERSHQSASQPGSVGLGLSVARALARLMGGT